MIIRTMTKEDYPAADAIIMRLHKIHVDGRPDMFRDVPHIYTEALFAETVCNENFICIAAEEPDGLAGICISRLEHKTCMKEMLSVYIDDLFVLEKYRHRGIATALYEETVRRARALGAVRLDLMVWDFNEEARAFYAAMGMKPQRYILEQPL